MVEHAAVNRVVVGSSPTSGATPQAVEVQRQLPKVGAKKRQLPEELPEDLQD